MIKPTSGSTHRADDGAISWIAATARLHMEIAVAAAETAAKLYPDGLAAAGGSYRATATT
jgi:hypothetical protein